VVVLSPDNDSGGNIVSGDADSGRSGKSEAGVIDEAGFLVYPAATKGHAVWCALRRVDVHI